MPFTKRRLPVSAILSVVKSTPAVESAFLAAGVTVCTVAALQSVAIVLSWI
jgi:hypothetical protein